MRPTDMLLALTVIGVWGCSFPITKLALEQLPPILFAALRFGLTAAILVPLVKPPPRRLLLSVFRFAATMGCLHFSLFFIGMAGTSGATAAISLNLQAPFAALIATLFLNDPIGWRRAAGIVLALVGLAVVGGDPEIGTDVIPFLILVASMLAWAIGNAQVRVMEPIGILRLTAWMALMATPLLLVASWIFEDGQGAALAGADGWAFAAVVYNSAAVYLFGHGTWYLLVQRYPLNNVVPFVLLIPVVGTATSVLFLGEDLTPQMIGGGLLALAGVAVIVLRRPVLLGAELRVKQDGKP